MSSKSVRMTGATETNRRQAISAAEKVSISGTTAKTSALSAGDYYVRANVACYWRQGPRSSITSTTAAGHALASGEEIVVRVTKTGVDDGLAFITDGASGTAEVSAVEAV